MALPSKSEVSQFCTWLLDKVFVVQGLIFNKVKKCFLLFIFTFELLMYKQLVILEASE